MQAIQQQVQDAARQIREGNKALRNGRQALETLLKGMTPEALTALAISSIMGDENLEALDSTLLIEGGITVEPHNVARSATASRSPRTIDGRPSLPWAMQIIIKDAGTSLHANDIFTQLEKRDWMPVSKNVRAYVSRVLSGAPQIFIRDTVKGRGHYGLPPNFVVPEFPGGSKPMKTAEVTATTETIAKPSNGNKAAKDVLPRALELLQHTRKPVSFADIVKALKIRGLDFQAHGMGMVRDGILVKTKRKSEDNRALFEIDRKALNARVKRIETAN